MIDKENRNQLDRIAAIVGSDFGVADPGGTVLYSGSCNIAEGSCIFQRDPEDGGGAFSLCGGYYVMPCEIGGSEPALFFLSADGESEDSAKRLLELAVCAYDSRSEARERHLNDFLRVLITDGIAAVKAEDLGIYSDIIKSDAAYTVVLVSQDAAAGGEAEISVISEFLSGIFPSQEGCFTVPLSAESICAVCPVTEESPFGLLLETASLIKDTVLSELMVSVTVSVGTVVSGLRKIHFAYEAAYNAEMIGRMFELGGKCFVHDRLGLARLIYDLPEKKCRAFLYETFGRQFTEERIFKSGGSGDELLKTVKTFLATNQNISETSRSLYIHRNTLVYRLDKFNKMTGLDCTKFEDGMRVGIALLVLQYLAGMQEKAQGSGGGKLPGKTSGQEES